MSCLHELKFKFVKQDRVPLYSDRFAPVIYVQPISRDLSVLPHSCSIWSSPLSVSCLHEPKFKFVKQDRVPLYSDRFSPVIFVEFKSRDLIVLPQSLSIWSRPASVSCSHKPKFKFVKQGKVPLYSDRFAPVIYVQFSGELKL